MKRILPTGLFVLLLFASHLSYPFNLTKQCYEISNQVIQLHHANRDIAQCNQPLEYANIYFSILCMNIESPANASRTLKNAIIQLRQAESTSCIRYKEITKTRKDSEKLYSALKRKI